MDAVCLIVAGVLRATLPTAEFDLDWRHSVERIRWEEHYVVTGEQLLLTDARVEGNGAGMEPPPAARYRDGAWTWQPRQALRELRLTHSTFTQDYRMCWKGNCSGLGELTGPADEGAVVVVRACTSGRAR